MSKPTKTQREILELMAGGSDLEYGCYDYDAICVDGHRHIPLRTFAVLKAGGWIAPYADVVHPAGWFLTDLGRQALKAAATPSTPDAGEGPG